MSSSKADSSRINNREYHLQTRRGDIAPYCILVGAPERARMIANDLLSGSKLVGDHRGLLSFTGAYNNVEVSVIATGMGSPSVGIVLPEAYRSGARTFIRVGSCGSLIPKSSPGDVIIVTSAARLEGASQNWAPIWFPAAANHKVISALEQVASKLAPKSFHLGVEASTDCFNEGQARPNVDNMVSSESLRRHHEILRLGIACYSMEASALFVWCATHGEGLPCGAINTIYANRRTNISKVCGDELASKIALEAIASLAH